MRSARHGELFADPAQSAGVAPVRDAASLAIKKGRHVARFALADSRLGHGRAGRERLRRNDPPYEIFRGVLQLPGNVDPLAQPLEGRRHFAVSPAQTRDGVTTPATIATQQYRRPVRITAGERFRHLEI